VESVEEGQVMKKQKEKKEYLSREESRLLEKFRSSPRRSSRTRTRPGSQYQVGN
jgi:hypothetical protein